MKRFLGVAWLGLSMGAVAEEQPKMTVDDLREFLKKNGNEIESLAKVFVENADTNKLFYFPTRDEPATPAKWGFRYEDVKFKSADGTDLHGWFLKAKGKTTKGTVVFSHGNAGSLGHHLGFVMWMAEAGYQVLMYDYRGFGKSGGTVDRKGMVEDVKAAFDYALSRKDVASNHIISYGHSLGGAKSVTALAEKQPEGLRAIVIDGAFSSYQAMAKYIGGDVGAKLISDELSPKDYISKIKGVPLLVVHGEKDAVVPFSQGKDMFDLANQPKTLFAVKEAGHGDALSRDSGEYRKRMLVWLDERM